MEVEVIRSARKTLAVEIRGDRLLIRAPARATEREIRAFLERHRAWIEKRLAAAQARQAELRTVQKLSAEELRQLKEQARQLIPQRVALYAPLVGVRYGRISIRCQRTRWGSCSSRGNLSFNCLLMLAPPEVLDSVVVHELCHLKEMNHSPRFYAQVLRVFPDYKKHRRWLKENGPLLIMLI